jgi:hypothetical protein
MGAGPENSLYGTQGETSEPPMGPIRAPQAAPCAWRYTPLILARQALAL